ncbi:MAG: hypothetical protein QMD17_02670 [Rhodocyclaceae bacterium]|jgi:hypothetical protein|nr:hypothetical protein [Rhodocyclaceae bacterium]
MTLISKNLATALLLAAVPAIAFAQAKTTASVGLDYSEGKYGESETSRTWSMPVSIKHETGPLTLKLSVPYVRSSGVAAAGGDRRVATTNQTQSGMGDMTASAFYNVYSDAKTKSGVDLGVKAKFATADSAKTLLTTGENDYSLQADLWRGFGDTTLFGSLGWTKKGDTSTTDFRNPWYGSIGFSNKLSDANSWGASYDYRQKVTTNGDPVSELSMFMVHKYSKAMKVQGYVVTGFSDASPDLGVGATFSYSF